MSSIPHKIKVVRYEIMSRTIRALPENHSGIRHPHILNQLRQLKGIEADEQHLGFNISPRNRIHKNNQTDYDDLTPSSAAEVHLT